MAHIMQDAPTFIISIAMWAHLNIIYDQGLHLLLRKIE